jgi:hypothetical protein
MKRARAPLAEGADPDRPLVMRHTAATEPEDLKDYAALLEGGKMDELSLLAIAEAIKSEAGVIQHRIIDPYREGLRGWAYPQRKIIYAAEGRTPEDLYYVAHECAHVALRHDHQKPLHVREYEAEKWAHEALQTHGVAIPEHTSVDATLNVFFAISDADERGQFGRRAKRLSAEAAEWSGWNLPGLDANEIALAMEPDPRLDALVEAYIARRIVERDDPACAAAQRERLRRREQRLGAARARAQNAAPRRTRRRNEPCPGSSRE